MIVLSYYTDISKRGSVHIIDPISVLSIELFHICIRNRLTLDLKCLDAHSITSLEPPLPSQCAYIDPTKRGLRACHYVSFGIDQAQYCRSEYHQGCTSSRHISSNTTDICSLHSGKQIDNLMKTNSNKSNTER